MSSRLFFAFLVSLALHGIMLYPGLVKLFATTPRPVLQAILRPLSVPVPQPQDEPDDNLLKNTLERAQIEETPKPVPDSTPDASQVRRKKKHQQTIEAAQQKLSEHLFYPPQAIAQGTEGDVWLILTLDEKGSVLDVNIATSSGHPILDNAAIKAAYAMGRQAGADSRELIVPVHFRLE